MLIKLLSLIGFLLVYSGLSAEASSKDSLFQIIDNERLAKETRMEALLTLVNDHYFKKNPDSTQLFSQRLLEWAVESKNKAMEGRALLFLGNAAFMRSIYGLADSLYKESYLAYQAVNDSNGLANIYNARGVLNRFKGEPDLAMEQFQKAIGVWQRSGEKGAIVPALINVASIYEIRGDIRTSLENNLKAVELAVGTNQIRFEGIARNNLANNYKSLNDIPNSAEQYLKALAIYEVLEDVQSMAGTLNNLGLLYMAGKDFTRALKYLNQAHQLSLDEELVENRAMTLSNLGAVHSNQGNFTEALKAFKGALKIIEEHKILFIIPYHELEIGFAYLNMGLLDSAGIYLIQGMANGEKIGREDDLLTGNLYLSELYEQNGEWAKALKYAQRGMEISQNNGRLGFSENFAEQLIDLYKHFGQNREVIAMLELQMQLKDSLYNEENTRSLIKQEIEYTYQKEAYQDSLNNAAKLELQQSDLRRRRTINWSLGGLLLLLGLFGGILLNRYRIIQRQKKEIQEEKNKSEAANTKLKEIDRTKSRFFTNISHELRTPLTIISGMASKINQNPDQWLTKGTRMIDRNAGELLNLVNQILDLRKLEAGKLDPQMVQGDIISFINYISESFHSMGESKQVELLFQSELEELILDHDPDMILRIVSNLLSNAIKYSEASDTVRLKVSSVPTPKSLNKNTTECLMIIVQDEGIGIPKTQLPHIFDRFYQVDDSSTRAGEGTGIGLSLTRELIRLLGGTIEVKSKEGEGSTFSVWLPIYRTAPMVSENAFPLKRPVISSIHEEEELVATMDRIGSGAALPSLLIIEDNADVRQYLTACLEGHYTLSYATDGEAGIEKALEEVPDIIISDVMMPKKDGFEVCDTLKKDVRTSHIPIIMLTAKSDADSRISGLQVGADAYLSKPFNEKELFVRLEKLIEIRRTLQERYGAIGDKIPTGSTTNKLEEDFILEVQAIIRKNLSDENFGIAELYRAVGMSRAQLHNKLKSLTGRSTSHYIRSIRIHEAKDKLINRPELNISDIAFETGFPNLKYFSKVFTEEIGSSPSQFRKNIVANKT